MNAPHHGFETREWQSKAVVDIAAAHAKHRAVVFVAPAGAGKTRVEAMYLVANPTWRALVAVPTRENAIQAARQLRALGITCGFLMADAPEAPDPTARVQIGTVASLTRAERRNDLPKPGEIELLVFDEAHHAMADTWTRLAKRYRKARVLGLTASPWRLDGKPLGEHFDVIVAGPQPSELVALGHIASPFIWTQDHQLVTPDTTADFGAATRRQAGDRIIVGNVYQHWLAHAPETQTVHFAPTLEFSRALVAEFRRSGFNAEHIEGRISSRDRDSILARFASGEITMLSTVGLLGEGWDMPSAQTMICTRPTGSLTLWLQQCGRVMRPGGARIILDHAGNAVRLKHPCTDREWALTKGARETRTPLGERMVECEKCGARYPQRLVACGACGHVPEQAERARIEQRAGQLVPLREMTDEELWSELRRRFAMSQHPGSNAAATFRRLRGREPPWESNTMLGKRAARRAMSDSDLWESLLVDYSDRGGAAAQFRKLRNCDPPNWDEETRRLRSTASKARAARLSPEDRRAFAVRANAALTKEQRSAISKRTRANIPSERWREIARMGNAARSKETKARVQQLMVSARTSEQCRETLAKNRAAMLKPGCVSIEHARRGIGVSHETLRVWLRAAGIDTSHGVLPADVDRVVAEHRAKQRTK